MGFSPPVGALCREIRNDMLTLPGLARVHTDVPDALTEFPAVVVAPSAGGCWLASHATEHDTYTMFCRNVITVEVHVPHKDLPSDLEQLVSVCDGLAGWLYAGFARDRWGYTVVTTGNPNVSQNATEPLQYEIQEGLYGGQQTLAWVVSIEVTTEQEIVP